MIVAAARTPVGRQHGALSEIRTDDLAAVALKAVAERVPTDLVEEVGCGMVNASGEAMGNPARFAALLAGLPESVAGFTTNRYCGSGATALTLLAADIAMGAHRGGIAVGAESMSRSTWPLPIPLSTRSTAPVSGRNAMWSGAGGPQHPALEACGAMIDMAPGAQHVADALGITRAEMDEYAVESHRRAAAAVAAGHFADEIITVSAPAGTVTSDETIRPDTSLDRLARLRPYHPDAPDITAGNSSPVNDGASAVAVIDSAEALAAGLTPLAAIVGYTAVGVAPKDFATGPVVAVNRLLERHSLKVSDIGLFEINEAFAAQAIACIRQLRLNPEWVNVNGGALALGHALGNSGTRIVVTLIAEMRRRGVEFGVASLCIGAGQAIGVLLRGAP